MKILIVDDHPLVRKGLTLTLSFEENVETIYEASNVEEATKIIINDSPEIVIVDLKLGKEDGLEIVDKIKKRKLKTKFIVLTSSGKKDDFLRAQEVDVDGYILKDAYAEDIIYAFHVVERGKKFFATEILQKGENQYEESGLDQLTEREKDVLLELGKGFSNLQIAEDLYISEHTVKKHISNIFSKLGLNHRTEAAIFINDVMKA